MFQCISQPIQFTKQPSKKSYESTEEQSTRSRVFTTRPWGYLTPQRLSQLGPKKIWIIFWELDFFEHMGMLGMEQLQIAFLAIYIRVILYTATFYLYFPHVPKFGEIVPAAALAKLYCIVLLSQLEL